MSPADTSPDAREAQIRIYRQMSPSRRVAIGVELAEMSRRLLRDGLRTRRPDLDERGLHLLTIRLWLGEALFQQVYGDRSEERP
jgi:hypothetical protein